MDTRKYLEQVQDCDRKIQNKIAEEQRLRALAMSISSFSMGDKVQTTPGTDRIGNAVSEILDIQQEIAKDVEEMAKIQHEVAMAIDSMDSSLYSTLLHKRYIEYKSLVTVANEMGYSVQHIRSCHLKAIEAMKKIKHFES